MSHQPLPLPKECLLGAVETNTDARTYIRNRKDQGRTDRHSRWGVIIISTPVLQYQFRTATLALSDQDAVAKGQPTRRAMAVGY